MQRTASTASLRAIPRALVLLAFLAASSAGWSRVVYVNKNALGSVHDGAAWSTAYLTVQAGIDAAANGDDVWVAAPKPAADAYVESVVLKASVHLYGGFSGTEMSRNQRNWTANVTELRSATMDSSIVVWTEGPGCILDGFAISHGDVGVRLFGSTRIANCTIRAARMAVCAYTGDTAVVNSFISHCTIGIGGYEDATVAVSNCEINGCGYGLQTPITRTSITNCSITGNQCGVQVANAIVTIANSLVGFNGTGIEQTWTIEPVRLSHNNVYGNSVANYSGVADPTGASGNISQDPRLSNPYHDIHIQPGSPCINAGDDLQVMPGWTDRDGQPRVQGGHVDIGADESDGSVWTVPSRSWRVSPAGDDRNDGLTWRTAKRTLGAALSAAQGTDELWVVKGSYSESIELPAGVAVFGGFTGTETKRDQRDWAKNVSALGGGGTDFDTVVAAPYLGAALDGFAISKGGSGVVVGGTTTIAHCRISDAVSYGVNVDALGRATISDCTISRTGTGVNLPAGTATLTGCTITRTDDGVSLTGGTALVSNCTVSCTLRGVYGYSGTASLANCTISGNGCGVYLWTHVAWSLANCIVAGNGTGIRRADESQSLTLSHNDVYGNAGSNYTGIADPTGENGNISQDPRLSNSFHDLHIQPGSPCIDSGDDAMVQAGSADMDGQPRVQGSHVDIGADESDGAAWAVPPRVWHVSMAGDDVNDGLSWATAKRSLSRALDVAEGADEVWVARGLYVDKPIAAVPVALYGGFEGGEARRSQRNWTANLTEIRGDTTYNSSAVTLRFPGVILDGFAVTNGYFGVTTKNAATISHCRISGNVVGVAAQGEGTRVRNCAVVGNGTGVWLASPSEIVNCTFAGGSADAADLSVSGSTLTNCAIASNAWGFYAFSSRIAWTASYCNVFGNSAANFYGVTDPTGTNGNISVDPLFVNASVGDYRLLTGSPCVDAGDDAVFGLGEVDLDGKPRKMGAHVDIGCYEFAPSAAYALGDAVSILKVAAGIQAASSDALTRLNPEAPVNRVDIVDAVRIIRKVQGLDGNP
ncbi:MAG TPA: right-handed parallel beta-helix repeat-containing protein [Armatimonadota bacterium]|jgi:hypothetical protein